MALSGVFSKVAFATKVPMLLKATSDDANPTPGYLFEEIARITNESVDHCENLVLFLLDRVKKTSCHVKLKTLLVIKAVLEKGNAEFKASLRHKAGPIREAKSFNGPPDALYGDYHSVEIRKVASRVLEILFNVDDEQQNRGFSSNNLGSSYQHVYQKKMEGFGVSMPANRNTFASTWSTFTANIPAKSFKKEDNGSHINYQRHTNHERPGYSAPSEAITSLLCGNRTLNQGDSQQEESQWRSTDVEEADKHKQIDWIRVGLQNSNQDIPQERLPQQVAFARKNWLLEEKIVNEFTSPGGVRVQHPKQETDQFLKRCATLCLSKIVELLRDKLDSTTTQVQLRALILLENLYLSYMDEVKDLVKEHCQQKITELKEAGTAAVKTKANQVLLAMISPPVPSKMLDTPVLEDKMPQEQNKDTSSQSGNNSLLLFLPDITSQTASEPTSDVTENNQSLATDLFSGLTLAANANMSTVSHTKDCKDPPENSNNENVDTSLATIDSATYSTHITDTDPFETFLAPTRSGQSEYDQPESKTKSSSSDLLGLDPFAALGTENSQSANTKLVGGSGSSSSLSMLPHSVTSQMKELCVTSLDPFSSTSAGMQPQALPSKTSGEAILFKQPPDEHYLSNSNRLSTEKNVSEFQPHTLGLTSKQSPLFPTIALTPTLPEENIYAGNRTLSYQSVPNGSRPPTQRNQNFGSTHTSSQHRPSFGFISKKGDAFDFVKDAIEESKRPK